MRDGPNQNLWMMLFGCLAECVKYLSCLSLIVLHGGVVFECSVTNWFAFSHSTSVLKNASSVLIFIVGASELVSVSWDIGIDRCGGYGDWPTHTPTVPEQSLSIICSSVGSSLAQAGFSVMIWFNRLYVL